MKIVKAVFLAGIFLLPFIYWPKAPIPYEIPRVWFFCRLTEILVIIGIIRLFFGRKNFKKRKVDHQLIFLVFLFALTAVITSFSGVNLSQSFWGNYYRNDGLLTFFHLIGLFLFLILFWRRLWLRETFLAISLGSVLTSLWSLYLGFRFYVLKDFTVSPWGKAIGASFGQPNFLAGYLLVCLPFLLYFLNKAEYWKAKLFWLMALIIQVLAIFLTYSQAGALGIVIFLLLWILFKKNFLLKLFSKKILGLFFLILMALIIFWLYFNFNRPIEDFVLFPERRERIFIKAILGFLKRPVLGWGWANFGNVFKSIAWPIKFDQDVYVDKAHSVILEVLTSTGIIGLIVYLLIIFRAIKKLLIKIKSKNQYLKEHKTIFFVFLLFIFHSQTNIISIAEEIIFWLILAISCRIY